MLVWILRCICWRSNLSIFGIKENTIFLHFIVKEYIRNAINETSIDILFDSVRLTDFQFISHHIFATISPSTCFCVLSAARVHSKLWASWLTGFYWGAEISAIIQEIQVVGLEHLSSFTSDFIMEKCQTFKGGTAREVQWGHSVPPLALAATPILTVANWNVNK